MPFSIVFWIGKVLGEIDYLLSGTKRIEKMVRNISQVFNTDEKKSKSVVKKNLHNHCRNILEFIKYPQLNQNNITNFLSIEGIGVLDKELEKGKGVILATAHFGAKQLLQVGLGLRGYSLNQIHYHMTAKELTFIQKKVSQRLRMKIEEKIPAEFISIKSFMRSAYSCLMKNQILVVAGDGIGLPEHMNKGYSSFSFLGKDVYFPSNILNLAKRTGASVVPAFVIREREMHKIIIEPAIKSDLKSIEDIFKEFVEIFEKYVHQYPCLWEFWEEFEEGNLIVASERNKSTVEQISGSTIITKTAN